MKQAASLLCVILLLATAFAQAPSKSTLQASIPFGFLASGKMFPAGHYTFRFSSDGVRITNYDRNESVFLPPIMRLEDKSLAKTAQISFDVQDGRPSIEALWPGNEDGYLLQTVKGKRTHLVVNAAVGDGDPLAYKK